MIIFLYFIFGMNKQDSNWETLGSQFFNEDTKLHKPPKDNKAGGENKR